MTEPSRLDHAGRLVTRSSTRARGARARSVAVTVLLAVLMSLVPLVALEAIGVSPAGADATCPCSLWSNATTPFISDFADTQAVELGVQFSSSTNGYVTAVRFFKGAGNTGEHIGSLWSSDGTLLARATFAAESATGWQQVAFSTPVAVVAGTTYIASYHTNTGHYSVDPGYFSDHSYTNAPLTAPGGSSAVPNGLFAYSATPTFPTGSFNGNNYWVDLVFSSQPQPVSVTVSSVQGSMPKGTSQPLSATETFSDGTTKDVTSTATWSSSNPAVGSVSPGGVFSATGTGSTTVSATIDGLSGQTTVTVLASVSYLVVNPTFSVLGPNQTKQLSATARLTDGSQLTVTRLVRWSTVFGCGASISSTGLVTAGRYGAGAFTASLGRATGYAAVVVLPFGLW